MSLSCLLVWPIATPAFYSDTWRNTWLYEMESYVSGEIPEADFDIFDGSKFSMFESFINKICLNNYDIIFVVAPLDSMDGFLKTIYYIRQVSPSSKIFAYGYATVLNQTYFESLDIDAFALTGDFEHAVKTYVNFQITNEQPYNVATKEGTIWKSYVGLQKENMNWKFIRPEYVADWDVIRLTVARGCVGNCPFCIAPALHGCKEQRKSTKEIMDYIGELHKYGYTSKPIEFAAPSVLTSCDL